MGVRGEVPERVAQNVIELTVLQVGIDWAGTMVERVSGMSLNDYFQKHIFEPLGIKNINMFPTEQMKSKLAYMHAKGPDGKIVERDHIHRRPLIVDSADDIKKNI